MESMSNLENGFSESIPDLDTKQLGHLRHIIRLSRQAPGDWSDMGPFDPTNEGDDAYRYQLAYMAYTLAVAQHHYFPAYRELFKETFQRLIDKMMRHDVWGYWELTSKGSKVMDPDLEVLVDGWVDPVVGKNVMYSGHLLMMVGLYEMLYRDGKYTKDGSLTFMCRPPFRGLGPQDFPYDFHKLSSVIEAQFAASHGMGCECEPNGVFVYCNQFALMGLKLYDHVFGTNRSEQLFKKFKASWAQKSNLFKPAGTGQLPVFFAVKQNQVITEEGPDNKEAASVVSWGPMLHIWEPEYVEGLYPSVIRDVRTKTSNGFGVSLEQFHRTHLAYQEKPSTDLVDPMMLGVHTHGMLGLLAAEMGDEETKQGLLAHADAKMNPVWKEGGLFYPRCDDLSTENYVTCVTGNALLGATRIVPKNGLSNLFNKAWTEVELSIPVFSGVPYPLALVTRAGHSSEGSVINLIPGDGEPKPFELRLEGLVAGGVYRVSTRLPGSQENCDHKAGSDGVLKFFVQIDEPTEILVGLAD
ncbi:MAG: hypothetical protein RIQ37_853 [Actinomycetota bacterium]